MTAVAAAYGLVAGWVVERALRDALSAPAFQRRNRRDELVVTAAGVAAVLVVLTGAAGVAVMGALGVEVASAVAPWSVTATTSAVTGFGLLGLLDDLGGDRSTKGLRGHLAALVRGRPTTGSLKLVGGLAVAVVAVGAVPAQGDRLAALVVGALVVALSANAANLFDLAPARATKVAVLVAVPVAVVAPATAAAGPVAAIAAVVALVPAELEERSMLGDTGANVLGASVGLLVVATFALVGQLVALGVLVGLNLASERVSFSAVIARHPLLARLDMLGRRP